MTSVTRIENVDLFMLQAADFDPARDPVRDTLLARVRAGQYEGWGECEAAPFVSLAAFVTPESHSTSRPVSASVLGQRLETPDDIAAITRQVLHDSMNILQTPHLYSAVEMALWDLLGKKLQQPVYRLLGYDRAFAKQAYVVVPLAQTPEETHRRMRKARAAGYTAVKTGWNGFGSGDFLADRNQLAAAREALGPDTRLFLDAARIWGGDLNAAMRYCPLMDEFGIEWVEEPFDVAEFGAYADLSRLWGRQRVAAGENTHSHAQAMQLLEIANLGVIQVDCGRIGGIGTATEIARYADRTGAFYVNHTYTSHLALSAALQCYAGLQRHDLCEYPMDRSSLSWKICRTHVPLDPNGMVTLPNLPGLGIGLNFAAVKSFTVELEMRIGQTVIYRTPDI